MPSRTTAIIRVGPTLAGIVLDALRASGAMLLDALTYLVSAVCIWFAVPQAHPCDRLLGGEAAAIGARRTIGVVEGIKEGISFVGKHPLLRTFAVGSAVWNFSWSAGLAVLVIQLSRNLHLGATQTGLVFAAGATRCGDNHAPSPSVREMAVGKLDRHKPFVN